MIVRLGVAAAAVQVVGLLRWPLVVPFIDDPATLHTLSTVLGTIIGETLGYLLTAAFTIAVVRGLARLSRAVSTLGLVSAILIATGVSSLSTCPAPTSPTSPATCSGAPGSSRSPSR